MASNDILLPSAGEKPAQGPSRFAAFVPITLALLGVGAILLGGVSARTSDTATAALTTVDPIVTDSIALPAEKRHALEMLDR